MENSKKRKFIDVVLVITCIVVLATISFHFYTKRKQNEAIRGQEYSLKEQVVWDLYHHYKSLKDFSSSWNTDYAKLTLDENRDTIEYPKYTVKELTRVHNRIQSSINNYENNPMLIHHKMDITEISTLFSTGYDSRQLLSTYKFREKLYSQAKDLNDIYVTIVNNSKLTDSVDVTYDTESKFYSYFTSLRKLDRIIYELLSDEYPRSLQYAINTEKEFITSAEKRLFDKQINDLRFPSDYRVYMPEALNLKQNVMACLGDKNLPITNLEFEVNQGKAFLLVALDTLENRNAQETRNTVAKELYTCYTSIKKDYDRKLFFYMLSPDGKAQVKWPGQTALVEASERNLDSLFKFYEDNSTPYLVEGTFAPLYLWYPKTIDEAIKEYNKTP